MVPGGRHGALRPMLTALCTVLAAAGCTGPVAQGGRSSAEPTAGPSSVAATCMSSALRIKAGREGESQGAHGDIEFTNVGSAPCMLRGLPQVALVRADGKTLPVRVVRAADLNLRSVVLQPGKMEAADLAVFWQNWCGQPPGRLSVKVTLPAGGVVTGPFNGPPDGSFVPGCVSPGQPSTISVLDAYTASGTTAEGGGIADQWSG